MRLIRVSPANILKQNRKTSLFLSFKRCDLGRIRLLFSRRIFKMSLKGHPFNFSDILQKKLSEGVSEGQRVSPFTFFVTIRLLHNSHFCLKLGFLNMTHKYFFFNTIRNFNVISGTKRYIRILDVMPELYCVLLRRRRKFGIKGSRLFQHAIFESVMLYPK